ncbi:Amidase signature domain [Sesbania bispinosa]|nr:Amidase signature domain [Sesbania bispinosa]
METTSDYGAFMKRFILPPVSSPPGLPLSSLTFAVKDMFDVTSYVPGFGNPDWERTHSEATSIAPTIVALLKAGATCVGTTVMDELAYSIKGENIHYGTPRNPCVEDRVPGGSSSGSAVAVGAKLVDFSIGTDCLGSSRIPASFCGIFGIRPSHGVISESGVIPLAQSLDTVGWFARDPTILNKVGRVLLKSSNIAHVRPTHVIIADDCFPLSSIPYEVLTHDIIKAVKKLYGGDVIKHEILGLYVMEKVPSLIHFMCKCKEKIDQIYNIPLAALSCAMQLLERYEFKQNHGEWVLAVKPNLGPEIAKSVEEALQTTGENIDTCHYIKKELRAALNALLGDFGVLMIPTVPGPPPEKQTNLSQRKDYRGRAFSLQSIAGMSGCCQVSIPLGMYDNLPISISLVAKHGADEFLLSLVEAIYESIKEDGAPCQKT